MHDREKVINDLEESISFFRDRLYGDKYEVWLKASYDALALLKAQEARLVAEADFENADAYGFLPVWVEDKDDSEIICDCITIHAVREPDEDYHYRYWTSRPTLEQMDATPWSEQDQREYQAAVEMAEYCERYEPTYNSEDGSM